MELIKVILGDIMEKSVKKNLSRHWGAILARGLVAIIIAVLLLGWTNLSLEIMVILLGLYLVLDGVFSIIGSIKAMVEHHRWWIQLLQGLLVIILGIMVFTWPSITVIVLLYFVAIFAIISGIFELWVAVGSPWEPAVKYLAGCLGVISLLLGFIMLAFPLSTLIVIIWLVAIYLLVIGLFLIIFSFQLKRLK